MSGGQILPGLMAASNKVYAEDTARCNEAVDDALLSTRGLRLLDVRDRVQVTVSVQGAQTWLLDGKPFLEIGAPRFVTEQHEDSYTIRMTRDVRRIK